MKTYEWIIKIISYLLCCAAVCAGFAAKEQKARETLDSYIKSEENRKTEELYGLLVRLKSSLARCVSEKADGESYAEASYCCKAASDAVCALNGGRESEALRMFFDRVKNVCDEAYTDNGAITPVRRQTVSELYMRLSALEDVLRSGGAGAEELISRLSSGLKTNETKNAEKISRISLNRAEKLAYQYMGPGVRLRSRGISDGCFVFASDRSCAVLTSKGKPFIKSRTVTEGAEHTGEREAAEAAESFLSNETGQACRARLDGKVFGIYYFTVICGEKEYPVGIDKTDGSVVFYVICQNPK